MTPAMALVNLEQVAARRQELVKAADTELATAVAEARAQGWSWPKIARAIGQSYQHTYEKYRNRGIS